jgi:hypothetical protein
MLRNDVTSVGFCCVATCWILTRSDISRNNERGADTNNCGGTSSGHRLDMATATAPTHATIDTAVAYAKRTSQIDLLPQTQPLQVEMPFHLIWANQDEWLGVEPLPSSAGASSLWEHSYMQWPHYGPIAAAIRVHKPLCRRIFGAGTIANRRHKRAPFLRYSALAALVLGSFDCSLYAV